MCKLNLSIVILLGITFFLSFLQSCSMEIEPELKQNANKLEETIMTKSSVPGSSNSVLNTYSPIGVIPDWALSEFSEEEKNIWTAISEYYSVDYSFVLSPKWESKKETIKKRAQAFYSDVLKGNVTKYGTVSVAMNNTVSKLNEIEKLSSPEGYDGLTEVNIIKDYPCASGIIQFTAHVSVITLGGKIIEASMGDYDFYFPTPNFAGSYGAYSTNSGYIVVYVVGRLEGEIININDNIFYL